MSLLPLRHKAITEAARFEVPQRMAQRLGLVPLSGRISIRRVSMQSSLTVQVANPSTVLRPQTHQPPRGQVNKVRAPCLRQSAHPASTPFLNSTDSTRIRGPLRLLSIQQAQAHQPQRMGTRNLFRTLIWHGCKKTSLKTLYKILLVRINSIYLAACLLS